MTTPTNRDDLVKMLEDAVAPPGLLVSASMAVADVLSALDEAGIALAPREATEEMEAAGRPEMPAEVDYWQEGGMLHAKLRDWRECVSPAKPYAKMVSASPYEKDRERWRRD